VRETHSSLIDMAPPSEKDLFDADLAKGRVLLKGNTLVWRMCACESTSSS
jgi:hypothetical protein